MSSSKLDVLAINETELDSYISDSEINLPVFDVARRDRTVNRRCNGGACVYLRNNIKYRVWEAFKDDPLESFVIEITRPHSRPFLISICMV